MHHFPLTKESNNVIDIGVIGQPQNVAETMCEKKQLKLEVESEKASDKAAGTIIEQKTKAGKKVKKNTIRYNKLRKKKKG